MASNRLYKNALVSFSSIQYLGHDIKAKIKSGKQISSNEISTGPLPVVQLKSCGSRRPAQQCTRWGHVVDPEGGARRGWNQSKNS